MEERKIRTAREEEIDFLEETLDLKFPRSYRQFLLEKGSEEVVGFQILGLAEREEKPEKQPKKEVPVRESPIEVDKSSPYYVELPELLDLEEIIELAKRGRGKVSVLQATQILRQKREDLPKTLAAISFHPFKDRVLCLDLREAPEDNFNLQKVVFLFDRNAFIT